MNLTERDIWKKDFVTRQYKKEQGDILNTPDKMDISSLADACTYCNNWDNPYAREIIKRSGHLPEYEATRNRAIKRDIFTESCRHYGIRMY